MNKVAPTPTAEAPKKWVASALMTCLDVDIHA
jgi:hypothetical protein